MSYEVCKNVNMLSGQHFFTFFGQTDLAENGH